MANLLVVFAVIGIATASSKTVSTLGGPNPASPGFVDGTSTTAKFSSPMGICVDDNRTLYVADASNHAIRMGTNSGGTYNWSTIGGPNPASPGF